MERDTEALNGLNDLPKITKCVYRVGTGNYACSHHGCPHLPMLFLPHCAMLCPTKGPFIGLLWKITHIYSVWADYQIKQI